MDDPLDLQIRLLSGDEPAMDPLKAMILAEIDRAGTITGAGRNLGLSYRNVWLLVDGMNRCWQEPLVETSTGGSGGGGAALTPTGREVLAAYRRMADRVAAAARSSDYAALAAKLRRFPLTPSAPSHPRSLAARK
jgi:molybdate transport system regulatory protein